VVQATPSTWRMLKNAGWSAARPLTVLSGGEPLTPDIAKYLLDQGHVLYNMYGPTEATIWSSSMRVTTPSHIHLGTPVLGTRYYLLDAAQQAVSDGQAGELVIHGACVGRGYLNGDTGAFVAIPGLDGIAYRTGDIVRAFGDGDIVYVGRKDRQLKLNGHRIEPDEVSARLRALIGNAEVFTVLREAPARHLCSFYHAAAPVEIDEVRVLAGLRRVLPAYMAPAALLRLPEIPLTPNGKIDLKRLARDPLSALGVREPVAPDAGSNLDAGTSDDPVLEAVCAVTGDTLGIAPPAGDTSLASLGLNSVNYILLSQTIRARLGVHIPPHRFYALRTLEAVAREAAAGTRPDTKVAPPAPAQPAPRAAATAADDASIAIIGYSVLMPHGLEADGFWEALAGKRDLVSERMRPGFRAPLHGGFLDDIEAFDAKFFAISPLEANQMDPRQRLLLQTSWRAIEDAGYATRDLAGRRIGCYIAATGADYATLRARADGGINPYSLPGCSLSILANRLSSFFDWTGPSFTLDTACAGSLSAMVKACNDLASGVAEAALVGGVNIIADDQISRELQAGNFMSPNFRCATFDESADGYVRGEGVGCFLLKRLDRAIDDGDAIHGVFLAFRENHGGRANSLTAPNPEAQAALVTDTYTAELARRVSYIETHGTGTRLGDSIEVDALKTAWNRLGGGERGQTVWLGAVKSNIGHLEAAAGMASLAKVLLAMRHRMLPANQHFSRLNPLISLDGSAFSILDRARPWLAPDGLVAGFGGSNAHTVLGEAPPPPGLGAGGARSCHLVTLSARSERSLEAMKAELATFVAARAQAEGGLDLESLAFTLNTGRSHFEYRAAWVVTGAGDLAQQLALPLAACRIPVGTPPAAECAVADCEDRLTSLLRLRDLYLRGHQLDWSALHRGERRQRMHLPTYRFDTRPFWFDRTRPERQIPAREMPARGVPAREAPVREIQLKVSSC
jgi:3-oxoacyl-(acyl-carrier-protein) synthase